MKTSWFLPLLLLSGHAALAESVRVKNHAYPVRKDRFDTEWELVGTHHYKFKRVVSVFTGAYYRQPDGRGEQLVFTYTRPIKGADLRKKADEHLVGVASPDIVQRYAELTETIQSAYRDVGPDNTYAITVVPGRGVWLTRDGHVVFHSDDAEFGDWYLDIWLGDPPIAPRLKTALLGGAS